MKNDITTFFKTGKRYKFSGKQLHKGWYLREGAGDAPWREGAVKLDIVESTILLVLESREVTWGNIVGVHEETAKISRDVKVLTQNGFIGWFFLKVEDWAEMLDGS